MKKCIINISSYFLLAVLCLGVKACSEPEVDPFSGQDGIYFHLSNTDWSYMPDSLIYSFYVPLKETEASKTVDLKISIYGYAADHDRHITIETDPVVAARQDAAIAGKHYEALPESIVLPAGQVSTILPVKFLYDATLDTKEYQLGIYLRENDDFCIKLPGRDHIRLFISNMATRPSYWRDSGAGCYASFGPYSRVKHAKCEEVLGVYFPATEAEYDSNVYEWGSRGRYMNQWFLDNPTKDEYGNPIMPWMS